MKQEIKKVQVVIGGKQFSLLSDEPEDHVLLSAQAVNTIVQEIAQAMPHADETKIALLAAIQIASSLKKSELLHKQHEQTIERSIAMIDALISQP